MNQATFHLCPEDQMTELLTMVQSDEHLGLAAIELTLTQYPTDPQLHFLKGSVLAGVQRYEEGLAAMRQSIEIAPGFELARFQLGFLEFTSGMTTDAFQTWAPFNTLPETAPFRLFAMGLVHLAQDNFAGCEQLLRQGIELNTEHPLINGDMQLILNEITPQLDAASDAGPAEAATTSASATRQLLQQFELKDSANKTKH
jgi:tetratricopeptide (TPR) repeat protein